MRRDAASGLFLSGRRTGRVRSAAAGLAAVLLALLAGAACGPSRGAGGQPAGAPTPEDAAVLEGRLLDGDGRPRAGAILLQAWPPTEEVEALASGEEIPTRELRRTRSREDGTFELVVAPSAIERLRDLTPAGDLVTLEVTGITDEAVGTVFVFADLDIDAGSVRAVYRDEGGREPLDGELTVVAAP